MEARVFIKGFLFLYEWREWQVVSNINRKIVSPPKNILKFESNILNISNDSYFQK